MGARNSLDVLSDITDHYESQGGSVRDVEAAMSQETGGVLHAEVEVAVPLCATAGGLQGGLTPEGAILTEDGTLQVELSMPDLLRLPSTNGTTVVSEERLTATDDGELLLSVELTICPPDRDGQSAVTDEQPDHRHRQRSESGEQSGSPETVADQTESLQAERDESVPPYEDTAYLEALYEACDTFKEMSRELEMEVSAETVRRYMIEAGVHEPETYETQRRDHDTDNDETEETEPAVSEDPLETIPDEQVITDGIGLPSDVTITDIADAVVESRSAHEVTRKLGLPEEETRRLLKQLNLLDFVLHRVGNGPRQEPSYDAIASRIRQCTPEEA